LNIVILIHTTFYPYDKMADFREMPPYPKAYYPQKEALWWTGHGKFMVPSMKRGDFMDTWPVLEDLSMKRGVFMDEYGRFCVRCGSI
jgi:hypothetical protein